MTGTGQLPKFEQDLFKTGVADRELFLIPTAEVPLTNLHARETLAVDDLPLAYTAHTPCFRSEAGSYGRDTRGLIRMHEFARSSWCGSWRRRRRGRSWSCWSTHAEAVLQGLGLAYRVVKLAAGDIGLLGADDLRRRGVAAGAAEVPGDRVGVGLRHVPGAARRHPHTRGRRQPRVRGHAEQLGDADRAHAGGDPGAGAAGRRIGADPARRWCRTPASRPSSRPDVAGVKARAARRRARVRGPGPARSGARRARRRRRAGPARPSRTCAGRRPRSGTSPWRSWARSTATDRRGRAAGPHRAPGPRRPPPPAARARAGRERTVRRPRAVDPGTIRRTARAHSPRSVGAAARRCGIPVDDRPYRPHLTLARGRPGTDLRPAVEALRGFAGSRGRPTRCTSSAAGWAPGPGGTAAHDGDRDLAARDA